MSKAITRIVGGEVVVGDALRQIARAEIDVQVATAKEYSRSVDAFIDKATTMATIDGDTAASCS